MKRILAIIISVFTVASIASAQTLNEKQSKRDKLEKEISLLESQIKSTSSKSNNALSSLNLIQAKLGKRKKLLRESNRELAVINDSIYAKQKEINRLTERLDTMKTYYAKLVKNAYKNRNPRIWYMYILASDNIGQASRRFNYLKSLSRQMNSHAQKIIQTREELEIRKEALKKMKKDALKIIEERKKEMLKLQSAEKENKDLINKLKKDKTKYQNQLNAKKKQVQALNTEINRLISSAMNSTKKSDAIDYKLAGEFESNKGKLPWPASGVVTEHFGQHNHPVYTKIVMPFNNGVTLAVAPGTVAKSVFDGVVKQIVVMPGYNQCVLVQHGNYFTFYCKLKSVKVKTGQKVTAGQAVGTVDTIAGETCLHFQLWKGKVPMDPELWLRD